MCQQALAGRFPISVTNWQNLVTQSNACNVLADLKLRRDGLRIPLKDRPDDPNRPGHKYVVAETPNYLLYEPLWDHEKNHAPRMKDRLVRAARKVEDWNRDPEVRKCLSEREACAILNYPQERIKFTKVREIDLRNWYTHLTLEEFDADEVEAQQAEVHAYNRIIQAISSSYPYLNCP